MGQPGPIIIPERSEKNLCFVFQSPEGIRINDAITVYLKSGSNGTGFFRSLPAKGFGTVTGKGGKECFFTLFTGFTDIHESGFHYIGSIEAV
jgi:hypothetical protein